MTAPTTDTTEHPGFRLAAVALTDGTIGANDAIARAARLLHDDATWRLAAIIDPHPSLLIATAGATSLGTPLLSPAELERQASQRRTAGAAAVANTTPVLTRPPLETVVLSGPGSTPLALYADEHHLDVIVSPTPIRHANAAERNTDLTDDLVASSPVPLLLVPTGERATDDDRADDDRDRDHDDHDHKITLLIAVDDTRLDRVVVDAALDVFDRPGVDGTAPTVLLHGVVVHVEPGSDAILSVPFSSGVLGSGGAALAALADQLDDRGRHAGLVADRVADRVAEHVAARLGDDHVTAIGDVGDPAIAILRLAAEHRADVIVVGTRNRSWFSRLFDPSVSEAVTDQARRPVLVVRSDLDDARDHAST